MPPVALDSLRSIARGDRIRDKLAIAFLLGRRALFPAARLLRRTGIELPDPGRWINSYTCRSDGLIYHCPQGGPFFLFCGSSHDPGVRGVVNSLQGGVFIDVGAHIGFFALPAAQRLGSRGRVVAIEPHPVRFQYLQQNVYRNQLENVTCLPFAASDFTGSSVIYDLDPRLVAHEHDVSLADHGGPAIPVETQTLDALCKDLALEDVRLVKIDVEGFEPSVIRGMQTLLAASSPSVVFEALTPKGLAECTELLQEQGYSVRAIDAQANYLAEKIQR